MPRNVLKIDPRSGHEVAQLRLAQLHEKGERPYVSSVDKALAVHWCTKAADAGYAPAQYKLAGYYMRGEHVPKDEAGAAELFELAAEQNHAASQYQLGLCYQQAEGKTLDVGLAVSWFKRSAALGFALFHLGRYI